MVVAPVEVIVTLPVLEPSDKPDLSRTYIVPAWVAVFVSVAVAPKVPPDVVDTS